VQEAANPPSAAASACGNRSLPPGACLGWWAFLTPCRLCDAHHRSAPAQSAPHALWREAQRRSCLHLALITDPGQLTV
jgi:hypothetical protein